MLNHPYVCTRRKFPLNCRYCGQLVVYWECYHGAKVFFDPPDLGKHQCGFSAGAHAPANHRGGAGGSQSAVGTHASANPYPPRASGKTALTNMSGVSLGVQPDDCGLMSGMKRVGPGVIDLRRSWEKMPEPSGRDTVAMRPYGDKTETVVGEVAALFKIDLAAKFGLQPKSIGAEMLGKTFPRLLATQVTILVDECLNDPDAVDKMSYTAWCPLDKAPRGLAKRAFVVAEISPREFWEFPDIGRKWLVESMESIEEESPFGA